jgi:hypothetical protein
VLTDYKCSFVFQNRHYVQRIPSLVEGDLALISFGRESGCHVPRKLVGLLQDGTRALSF